MAKMQRFTYKFSYNLDKILGWLRGPHVMLVTVVDLVKKCRFGVLVMPANVVPANFVPQVPTKIDFVGLRIKMCKKIVLFSWA